MFFKVEMVLKKIRIKKKENNDAKVLKRKNTKEKLLLYKSVKNSNC